MKSKNEMVEDLLGLVESGKLVAPGTAASGASAAGVLPLLALPSVVRVPRIVHLS